MLNQHFLMKVIEYIVHEYLYKKFESIK